MKSFQLNLEQQNFTFSTNTRPANSHYKFLMKIGRILPATKAQAKFFVQNGVCLDVLNSKDVEIIESLLTKRGFEGNYVYTKSKSWARLENNSDLIKALKLEYSI